MKALLIAGLFLLQITPTMRPGDTTAADTALIVSKLPRFTYERFGALPPTVRDQFRAMNCQVPQPSLTGTPQNVIQGEFAAKGQRDWAALCSNGSTTMVRIVWNGPVRCEDSFAARQDADTLVQPSPGVWNYGRTITTGSVAQINRVLLRSKAKLSESPAHDGIEDTIDRATLAHYCGGNHWQTIP